MTKIQDVTTYILKADEEAQPVMEVLRQIILETIPGLEEKISYNVPFYHYHGQFVGFSAHKQHISFGFGSDVVTAEMRSELEAKGYKLGKGTLQIKFNQAVPVAEIKTILKAKAVLNSEIERTKNNK